MPAEHIKRIFNAIKNKPKNLQEKTKQAIYHMAKNGDFDRTTNEDVDSALTQLYEDEEMSNIAANVLDSLTKKLKQPSSNKKTKKYKLKRPWANYKTRRQNH